MNTLIYRCFLAVAEERNFTRAANRMFVSQQTLSHHIAKLEQEYGVTLFERSKPLKLTYAGQKMLELSQQIVNLDRQVRNEMSEISSETVGELSIGVGRDRIYLLSSIFPQFHKIYPNYTVHCTGGFNQQLSQLLIANKVDMILSSTAQGLIGCESEPIMNDCLVLCIHDDLLKRVVNEDVYISARKTSCNPDFGLFESCPFALANENVKSRIFAESFFRANKLQPKIIATADYTEGLLSFALSAICATICFRAPLRNRLGQLDPKISDSIHLIQVPDLSETMKVQATWLKERSHSKALIFLRELLMTSGPLM